MIRHLSRPLASAIVVAAFILIALAAGIFARDSGGTVGAQVVGDGPTGRAGNTSEALDPDTVLRLLREHGRP